MSKEGNARRDDIIEALHAAAVSQAEGAGYKTSGATWWVFTSQTIDGTWVFTYKVSHVAPGEGWKIIPRRRISSINMRGEGDTGFIRVEP